MFGAEFRTALDEVQRETTGSYGFKITMQFCKNSYNRKDNEPVPESEIVVREYDFSSLSIPGQSNKLVVPRKASLIREVDGNNFIRIREISIYCKGYQQDLVGEHPNDIFISNFQLFSMQPLTEAQKNANTLKIIIDESQRKKGYFDLDNNNVFLKAILKSKTKTVKDTEKVKFYWYLKNNKINSIFYLDKDLYHIISWDLTQIMKKIIHQIALRKMKMENVCGRLPVKPLS